MKIDCPSNICKYCYENLVELTIKDPKTNKLIDICYDCYDEFYTPDLLEGEIQRLEEIENEKN